MGRFNFKEEKDFQKIKKNAEDFYKTIGNVQCPYFKCRITFNSKGLKYFWGVNKLKGERVLYSGNPEID